ncbi:MAG: hypothetical protein HYX92_05835 [Chloroflexi bacterium]|nr:hypothetical protein [Chloroflexota bacterium]
MSRKKSLMMASLFSVLGLLLASCAPAAPAPTPKPPAAAPTKAPAAAPTAAPAAAPTAKPAAPAPTPKPAGEQPRYGGAVTVGVAGDPPSLDLHREQTAYTFAPVAGAYNGLVKFDPHAWPEVKVVSDLAEKWDLSADGKVYTFQLAKGVKFHNGDTLTAKDVKYSFDRIRDPKLGLASSPRRTQLSNVTSIDAPDDSTVKITVGRPQASFIPFIGGHYFSVIPERVALEKKGDMTKTVMGTGPFKFKDYSTGVSWELVKNPDYFIKGRPYMDGIKGFIIKDSFTRFAALRTRSILWWAPLPYMTVSMTKVIAEQLSDKIAVKWEFHPAWYGAQFNMAMKPFNDVRVRQAVSLSFNRQKMLEIGLEGGGLVGMSAQPPGPWSLPEEELKKLPGYEKPDIEGAKKLMAEAGYPNGLATEALTRAAPAQEAVAQLVKDAVAAIGINLDIKSQETAVYMDQRFRRIYPLEASSAGLGHTDPDALLGDFYVTGAAYNFSGYSNPQYDELYAKQSQTLDVAERKKIVWEMQRILLKDVPIAIAYWSRVPYAWWKDVRGYTPPSLSHYHAYQYQDMWLAK